MSATGRRGQAGAALRLQQRWYRQAPPPLLLRPLAAFYGVVTALRRGLYRRGLLRSTRLPVPVVVVGNLTAGGAGKTPLVIAIAQHLRERGWRPGVVSRGHGRQSRDALRVRPGDHPAQVGDEPLLIAAAGVPVAVARRRSDAAVLLLAERCDVILADDGLQHYALARDIEVLVVDGRRRFGNGALLPAGPLREPVVRGRACDFVVANGGDPAAGETPMQLRQQDAVALVDGRRRALATFAGERVHAVAGIGDPQRFFDALAAHGIRCEPHPFPDHHGYQPGDLAFADAAPVLMTDKDAVKCQAFAQPHWYTVPVQAELPARFHAALAGRLQQRAAALAGATEREGG